TVRGRLLPVQRLDAGELLADVAQLFIDTAVIAERAAAIDSGAGSDRGHLCGCRARAGRRARRAIPKIEDGDGHAGHAPTPDREGSILLAEYLHRDPPMGVRGPLASRGWMGAGLPPVGLT